MARIYLRLLQTAGCALTICAVPAAIHSQGPKAQGSYAEREASGDPGVQALGDMIRQLQGQVGALTEQMKELRAEQAAERAQNGQLRKELDSAKAQIAAMGATSPPDSAAVPVNLEASAPTQPAGIPESQAESLLGLSDRVARLEEMDQLTQGKFGELNQSKVESGS